METAKSFKESDLSKDEQTTWTAFKTRKTILQEYRKNHFGIDLDKLFADADRDYVPHRLKKKGRKITTDEDKGWRGNVVELGSQNWQSDVSQSNPFIKIQTALSIMVDRNPSGVFTPASKKFTATNELMKQLYERSWEFAKSKAQLRLFIFNLAKYGWATARTYPLKLTRTVKVIDKYNEDEPDKTTYIEKEVTEYNDIFRENLDPRNVWMDDQAKPNNSATVSDWMFRKVYDLDEFKEEFKAWSRSRMVAAGGNTQDTIDSNSNTKTGNKNTVNTNLVEVFFYESKRKDQFLVVANNIPVVIAPLPVADASGSKKLSLWQTYWNIRHTESPYGVGIYESIRFDQAFLDRIRNMTVDQITLAIYKMFFYTGTNALSDTGEISIRPGVGKQVLNPKDISWLEVPGPGQDAYKGMEMFRRDLDEASGITDPLIGVVTGKTAFEIAQAKESALKRLRNPLDNILEALNEEGYITVSLIQLTYSVPETYEISDPALIEAYLKEIQSDPDLYDRNDNLDDSTGETGPRITAKVYREFPLNLEKDEKDNLIETKDSEFFRVKPKLLQWEGVIAIKSQSLLSPSKQVDKAMDLEMFNILSPMLAGMAQERMMKQQAGQPTDVDNLTMGKSAKEIIKLYDKDPKEIFPDEWLKEQQQPLFLNAQPQEVPQRQLSPQGPQAAPTLVPSVQGPQNPTSLTGQITSTATAPFKL